MQRCKKQLAKGTRMRTLASRAHKQIPRTARIASHSALNCARPARDSLFTLCALPARDDLMAISVHSLTAPLVCACPRSKSFVPAPSPSCAVSYSRIFLFAPSPARAAEWPQFNLVFPRWLSPSRSPTPSPSPSTSHSSARVAGEL